MKSKIISVFFISFLFISCNSSSSNFTEDEGIVNADFDWTVPLKDLRGNYNAFPFAENPVLTNISEVEGLFDDSTVAIISFNEQVYVYPHTYIQTYETVNHFLNGHFFTISYCPITQSTINLNRVVENQNLSFRASGILYKNNVVMHDSDSDTYWSQMRLQCIKGQFENQYLEVLPMVETTWKVAKTYFPNAKVFTSSSITGKNMNTNRTNDDITSVEKVFGVINDITGVNKDVSIYRYTDFNLGTVLYNNFFSEKKVIIGNESLRFIVAFINENDSTFEAIQNEFPIVMKDELGNKWNAFGIAVSGPDQGSRLKSVNGFVAYWWAWNDFYDSFNFVE
ncbi:DUF3179 domain-containing (seleno)protein [Lutibacter sp.]